MGTTTAPFPTQRVAWQVKFLLLSVIWGSSFLLMKVGLEALHPVQISTLRVVSGVVTLFVLCTLTRTALPRGRIVWAHLVVCGFFSAALPFTLFALAEQRVSSALAGIGNSITPVATMIMALLILPSDRPTMRKLVAVLVGLAGVVIILQPWDQLGRPDPIGFAMALAAGCCYGVGWSYNRRFLGRHDLGGLSQPTGQLLAAAAELMVILIFWWAVSGSRLSAPWSPQTGGHRVLLGVAAVLTLGVVGTGVAFMLHFDVVRAAGPTVGTMLTYLIPIVSVALGVVVLSEHLAWPQIVGAAIVIGAAAITQVKLPRRRSDAPPVEPDPVAHP